MEEIFTVNLTLCSKRQIDSEDFVNFRGLLRKYEFYNKGSSSYHLCVEYFSLFSFDSEMYTISAAVLKQLLINSL